MLAWIIALIIALWKRNNTSTRRVCIICAAVILLLVYSIPHSVMGSEYNYKTGQIQTVK
jgi:hypothetical protein